MRYLIIYTVGIIEEVDTFDFEREWNSRIYIVIDLERKLYTNGDVWGKIQER